MGHYKSNLRDIEFNLFELLHTEEFLGKGPFEGIDLDTAKSILSEVERLCTGELAASFEDSDRHPPVYDPATYSVTMPESFKKSYKAYTDGGWNTLDLPTHLGGFGAPASIRWSAAEMVLGANPAIYMYSAGTGFARIVDDLGTAEQKKIATHMIEKQWGATMVLTEPDAGSDVGAGRTKAFLNEDGTWRIEGVKRFITSAEWDVPENIIHLVLARPEGIEGLGGVGTKGLSLFIVPKFHFDMETGELGERNGAFVTNVEKKMGLKVSTTCEVTFGDKTPAIGNLVGEVHDGIAQMFKVIEYARMMVGTKAIATLSTGYLNALDYAKLRLQGSDMTEMTNKAAPRVAITAHPDVRRSLMTQKAYAEGMRTLVLYTAKLQDQIELLETTGGDEQEISRLVRLNDLMLPIVKGFGSERSYALLSESLQTLGGSGYLQEYPIEQYIRDAKIDTLYEGTTAIQGLDLFFRKIVRDNGQSLTALATEIHEFVKGGDTGDKLYVERELLGKALEDVQGMVGSLVGFALSSKEDPKAIYKIGLNTTRLIFSLGDLVTGYFLLWAAAVAIDKQPTAAAKDKGFYEGKIAAASFFARQILPEITSRRAILETTTLDLMELSEDAF